MEVTFKEILHFASIKLKNWQELKSKTPTLEQHNRTTETKMVWNTLLSYYAIQAIHLTKDIILIWILMVISLIW